ncbi:hypothetical protein [Paenibacillus abyssi]|uniref:Uncharacterized protein n=1 Tax=Paenibacillus abyssi TaxID=1340531 RepID=A0A917D6I6_9BACL|nr:hypothetical protein [Paenibacillus abyssi]GGG10704.1 hypothetical protein GCM10010916_29440 [Paenibacillus abyssi]
MDRLIEFIMSNLLYVVIVAGFLLSLFGKNKKGNRMPDFGGDGRQGQAPAQPAGPRRVEQERPSQPMYQQREPVPPAADPQPTISYPIPYTQPSVSSKEYTVEPRPNVRLERTRTDKAMVNNTSSLAEPGQRNPGREELRKAVLWAEILGPPRAKRRNVR